MIVIVGEDRLIKARVSGESSVSEVNDALNTALTS